MKMQYNTSSRTLYTVYTRILAERKTQNLNAEILGSSYTRITIITFIKNHHFDINLKGSAYMRVS